MPHTYRAEREQIEVSSGGFITPSSTGPSSFREFRPGPTRYYRDDVEITEAEFLAATSSDDEG